MTTWTQISTGAATTYEFGTYAALAFGEGCFADGAINEPWDVINTAQTASWTQVNTGTATTYDFGPYASLAFGEGCFADGAINEPWIVIPTAN